jgi:hypothetical protein
MRRSSAPATRAKRLFYFQATEKSDESSHEIVEEGGFFTLSLLWFVENLYSSDPYIAVSEAFDKIKSRTQGIARRYGKRQTPTLLAPSGGSSEIGFFSVLKCIDFVVILVLHYLGEMALHGARKDAMSLLKIIGNHFHGNSKIWLLMEDAPEEADTYLDVRQTLLVGTPTKAKFRRVIEEGIKSEKNMGIFVFAHLIEVIYNDGREDEEIYFPPSACDEHVSIDGRFIADVGNRFRGSYLVSWTDGCKAGGFPDANDFTKPMVNRGVYDDQRLVYLRDKALRNISRSQLVATQFELAKRPPSDLPLSVEAVLQAQQAFGSPSSARDQRDNVSTGTIACDGNTAANAIPSISIAGETIKPAPAQLVKRGAPSVFSVVRQWLETATMLDYYKNGVKFAGEICNYGEAIVGMFFKTDLRVLLGASTLLCIGLMFLSCVAATMLVLCFIGRHPIRTLGPAVIVTALTTLVPYLCDVGVLQMWVPFDKAFPVACWTFLVSLSTVIVCVMMNFDNLRWFERLRRNLGVSLALLMQARNLLLLGVHMHYFDQGPAIQQTMKIRVGGVDSYVVYYPMYLTKKGSLVCRVPGPDKKAYWLQNNSTFNQRVQGGEVADYTCQYKVFQDRVAQRAENKYENLHTLSFLEGQYVLNLTEVRQDIPYLQELVKGGGDPIVAEMLKPQDGSQFANWSIPQGDPEVLANNMTYLEWAAMPWMAFVRRSVALASTVHSVVWGLLGRLPL